MRAITTLVIHCSASPNAAPLMMVSINDHPAIREAFDGLVMHDRGIKYSVANTHGQPQESRELVITNYSRPSWRDCFEIGEI